MTKRLAIFATIIFIITTATVSAQKGKGAPESELRRGGEQITEVTLERTACFGTCPIYKITLRRDGTATYVGRRFVERQGTYNGQVYGFEHLAQLIESLGYFNLKDKYTANVTDLPSTLTSVVRAGRRKSVTNYGGTGPVELWGIETAIDGIVANTKWQQVSDK